MNITDLAALVAIRSHIIITMNDKSITNDKEDYRRLNQKRIDLDKAFVKAILNLNIDKLDAATWGPKIEDKPKMTQVEFEATKPKLRNGFVKYGEDFSDDDEDDDEDDEEVPVQKSPEELKAARDKIKAKLAEAEAFKTNLDAKETSLVVTESGKEALVESTGDEKPEVEKKIEKVQKEFAPVDDPEVLQRIKEEKEKLKQKGAVKRAKYTE